MLLANDGAEQFADELGEATIERVANDWFSTDLQRENLKKAQAAAVLPEVDRIGTVGCVALDSDANIAAGTSTGGLTNKKYGRVGDSPIIGAGNVCRQFHLRSQLHGHWRRLHPQLSGVQHFRSVAIRHICRWRRRSGLYWTINSTRSGAESLRSRQPERSSCSSIPRGCHERSRIPAVDMKSTWTDPGQNVERK